MSFSLLWLVPSGNRGIFNIRVLRGLVQHIGHRLRVVLVDGEEELSRLQPVSECGD